MQLIQFTSTLNNDFNSKLSKIKILPLGNVSTTKGNFVVDEISLNSIINTFKQRGLDIVIDYEHQSVSNNMAIASGWIKELFVEDDCLVGLAEWTKQAQEQIEKRQYKYLSPTLYLKNNRAVRLHSVALTNTPAIDKMYPLFLSDKLERNVEMVAVNTINTIIEVLGLEENVTDDIIIDTIQQLVNASKDNEISLNKDTPEVLALKEEIRELKENENKKEIDNILDDAIRVGKIVPAQRNGFKKIALVDKEAFKEVIKSQQKNSPILTTYSDKLTKDGRNGLSDEALAEFVKNNMKGYQNE